MNRVVCTLVLFGFFSLQAMAGAPFDYAQEAIQSLASVRDATNDVPQLANMEPSASLRAMMRAYVIQRTAIEAQGRRLEPYAASRDKMIADSAKLIIQGYELINANLMAAAMSIESVLNKPRRLLSEQGTTFREIYELEAKNQRAWAILIKVTTTIAFALYDDQRLGPDGKFQRLRITKAERDALKAELVSRYGKTITMGTRKDSPTNMAPGEILWSFLTNPKWLDADAK